MQQINHATQQISFPVESVNSWPLMDQAATFVAASGAAFARERRHSPAAAAAMLVVLILIVCAARVTCAATLHPVHASLAEIEWNADSGRFEVAMKLDSFEFEQQLSSVQSRTVNLETTSGIQDLVRAYVTDHFRLSTADCPACRIHWIGEELEFRDYWVYFEIELTSTADPAATQATLSRSADRAVPDAGVAKSDAPHVAVQADNLNAVVISAQQQRQLVRPALKPDPGTSVNTTAPIIGSDARTTGDGVVQPITVAPQRRGIRDATAASLLSTTLAGLTVHNSMMTELRPLQINYVTIRIGGTSVSVHLTTEHSQARIDEQSPLGRDPGPGTTIQPNIRPGRAAD